MFIFITNVILLYNAEVLKNIYRDRCRTLATSETLPPVTLVKWLKAVRESPREPNSEVAGIDNGPLIT